MIKLTVHGLNAKQFQNIQSGLADLELFETDVAIAPDQTYGITCWGETDCNKLIHVLHHDPLAALLA